MRPSRVWTRSSRIRSQSQSQQQRQHRQEPSPPPPQQRQQQYHHHHHQPQSAAASWLRPPPPPPPPLSPSTAAPSRMNTTTNNLHLRRVSSLASRRNGIGSCSGHVDHFRTQQYQQRRLFHDYFVTHLPSSSLHPDARSAGAGPNHHKLPRDKASPHTPEDEKRLPASIPTPASGARTGPDSAPPSIGAVSRETTVVRIPLRSAKHHFGVGVSRGSRPSNEDTFQAGTIEMPAFARPKPISLTRRGGTPAGEGQSASSASGDPQVFYYAVFDGHGGAQCSEFLRDRLHGYIEDAAEKFSIESSLRKTRGDASEDTKEQRKTQVLDLERQVVAAWRDTVGGYFKRFRPEFFADPKDRGVITSDAGGSSGPATAKDPASVEAMLTYAFLRADLDFTTAQASKHLPESAKPANSSSSSSSSSEDPNDEDDPVLADKPLNDNDVLSHPTKPASQNLTNSSLLDAPIGTATRFQGGSTASVALISSPTSTPYWHPSSPATLITAHCGDTRILLCRVDSGLPVPLTTDHHPSSPLEATRLRRYAATFVTDSFGEERVLGLANTRAFGDIGSKRIGVSAEPEIRSLEMQPGEFSFLLLVSDGVTGVLSDRECVDVVKEARTPEQAARELVGFATAVAGHKADNATALVVRLGGWERRGEGGGGSIGTKEIREWKRREAEDPRMSRR